MGRLEDLQAIVDAEGLSDGRVGNFEDRYQAAVLDKRVRELLELEEAQITDITSLLGIQNGGKVLAIREDLNQGVDNHKKPVVAGLILRGALKGRIPRKGIDTLIDGGNYNSAKALKYYTELLGMNGVYVMSRLFPQYVVDMLETEHFHVMRAPARDDIGREREFYNFLYEKMKGRNFRQNKYCLWHAKDGGKAMYPFGREIAT